MLVRWGVKELYLGRGIGGPEFKALPEIEDYASRKEASGAGSFYTEAIDFKSNPLSSWSTQSQIFAQWRDYVLFAKIPASRIISTAFTGPGCLNESEFIVIGGFDKVELGVATYRWGGELGSS